MRWHFLSFEDLTLDQLYDILHLRERVFVVEQSCAYQDADGHDKNTFHLLCEKEGRLIAYARVFPPGVEYHGVVLPDARIGRVVTAPEARGGGLGHAIMEQAIGAIQSQFGACNISISAQVRLQKYYAQHGFVRVGDDYLEDGIPHVRMTRVY